MESLSLATNPVVLITGAAGGIGGALIEAFERAGARVVAVDLPACVPAANSSHVDGQGEGARWFGGDISDEAGVQALARAVREAVGEIDVLVNNAAVLTPLKAVGESSLAEFERVMAVNLRGPFLLCRAFLPELVRRRGNIVNVSSMAGLHGEKEHAVYAASKGGLNALTQSIAIDYGAAGVRCNAICPSSVLTPNVDKLIAQSDDPAAIVELRRDITLLGTTARPAQIAQAAVFLASPAADFITGALLPVSGGSECGYGIKF